MEQFIMDTKIFMGNASIQKIKELGIKKAYLICDPFMEKSQKAGEIAALLEECGAQTCIFSDVIPDPSIEVVTAAIQGIKAMQPDTIIALGGGSAIDTAKAAGYLYGNMTGGKKPELIAIPTTSGTGSEVTSFAVISDPKTNSKYPLRDQTLVPDIAFLDSNLTVSVPPAVTADTGIDVLTHALEAYVSVNADDFTDACAEKAIRLVWKYLERAVTNGADLEAREHMHNASCLAGIAFSSASLGICHSMAHALGGYFHIPHGRSNALLLTHVINYNAGLDDPMESETLYRYVEIANMLGIGTGTPKTTVHSLITQIRNLMKRIGVPQYLSEIGIEKEQMESVLNDLAQNAMKDSCTDTNPKKPLQKELEDIYRKLYRGGFK